MVVVGAHHDRLGRERRVGPREDPDDIHAAPLLVAKVDPQTRTHARSERGRGLAADRGRDESDPGGGRVERWQRVADEQERRRAAPLRRDELLEPRHAPAVRGPVEDQDDLAVDSTPAQSSRLPYVPVPPWPAKATSPATSPLGEPPWGAKSRPTSSRRGAGLRISRAVAVPRRAARSMTKGWKYVPCAPPGRRPAAASHSAIRRAARSPPGVPERRPSMSGAASAATASAGAWAVGGGST